MSEFETAHCPRCGDSPDEAVSVLSEEIPGATIINWFCSVECRREYVDRRLEGATAYETVADQLTDAGLDPVAFDAADEDPADADTST